MHRSIALVAGEKKTNFCVMPVPKRSQKCLLAAIDATKRRADMMCVRIAAAKRH